MGEQDCQTQGERQLPKGPGQLLSEARVALGLSLSDVAQKICLSKNMVLDLENDDHTHVPAPVFSRGYLLSYARIVHIDEATILAALNSSELSLSHYSAEVKSVHASINTSWFYFIIKKPIIGLFIGLMALILTGWIFDHFLYRTHANHSELPITNGHASLLLPTHSSQSGADRKTTAPKKISLSLQPGSIVTSSNENDKT